MKKQYTLDDLQKLVGKQAEGRGGYWSDERIIRHAFKELSEVGEAMDLESGELKPKPGQKIPNIAHELADVMYAIICFANKRGINLTKALVEKTGINQARDKERFSDKK